jgi:hypothetical protein
MLLHRKDCSDYNDPTVNASRGMRQDVRAALEHFEIAFYDRNEIGAVSLRRPMRDLKKGRINRQFNLKDYGVTALAKK